MSDAPTEVEAGLIAACLAPYWDVSWGLLAPLVQSRDYNPAGGYMHFLLDDDERLQNLLDVLTGHKDDYPFGVTFSLAHYQLGGGAILWFPNAQEDFFSLEVYGYEDHDWPAVMAGGFSDFEIHED